MSPRESASDYPAVVQALAPNPEIVRKRIDILRDGVSLTGGRSEVIKAVRMIMMRDHRSGRRWSDTSADLLDVNRNRLAAQFAHNSAPHRVHRELLRLWEQTAAVVAGGDWSLEQAQTDALVLVEQMRPLVTGAELRDRERLALLMLLDLAEQWQTDRPTLPCRTLAEHLSAVEKQTVDPRVALRVLHRLCTTPWLSLAERGLPAGPDAIRTGRASAYRIHLPTAVGVTHLPVTTDVRHPDPTKLVPPDDGYEMCDTRCVTPDPDGAPASNGHRPNGDVVGPEIDGSSCRILRTEAEPEPDRRASTPPPPDPRPPGCYPLMGSCECTTYVRGEGSRMSRPCVVCGHPQVLHHGRTQTQRQPRLTMMDTSMTDETKPDYVNNRTDHQRQTQMRAKIDEADKERQRA